MSESKALVIVDDIKVPQVLNQQDFLEEMDGLQFSFTHVKIPSGGGLGFEVPGDDVDEPDIVKEIEGVLVHHHPVNAYWAEAYSGGNEPPDCSSMDGKIGIGAPGGDCKTCPMNEWGSGRDGVGKACQNRRRVYILRKNEMFPILISLPPTSLSNFSNFISRAILQKALRSYHVVSKVKLKKAANKDGIEYSQAAWGVVGKLDDKTIPEMRDYSNAVKDLAAGISIEDVEGREISEYDEHDIGGVAFKGKEVKDKE